MHTRRIATWSGPRNISTAMMRSWENRPDTVVCDEPFYAYYLQKTGLRHPGRDDILTIHESDCDAVISSLLAPKDVPIFYQKHMTHHLLPTMDKSWLSKVEHIFLIRDPKEMLMSLVHQIPNPTIEDTGLPQQLALFQTLSECDKTPIVLNSKDILLDPRAMLNKLCQQLQIPFYEEMLQWPAGPRESDGIWAPHWYASVEASTCFAPWKEKEEAFPSELESLSLECTLIYEQLASHTMTT